ncbi:sirohydrochlorin chelatase [Mycolicibacillus koreensis]|uniref:sirohydrochlorin chelatase n=1 Tax=Mycolicibacillus koreensis TaxID=1069220 RepID=UPI00084854EC|nr:cobalamin biosynthesis protein CbiX [Mycolicibacillus koreensis]
MAGRSVPRTTGVNRVLVAHGTRKPGGVAMIGELAERVSALLGQRVQVAFVDVVGPGPAEVLRADPAPAVVVPAFVARGFHVRRDLPTQLLASGHPEITVTPALGPSPALVGLLAAQLRSARRRRGDAVILAVAGSADPLARTDLADLAGQLAATTGCAVTLACAATGSPTVADAVVRARRDGAERVVVVSGLLADGLFQDRLRRCGADVVTAPLGAQPMLARIVAEHFRRASPAVAA